MVKIIFDCDDIHPEEGYGFLKEEGPLGLLKDLYDDFGVKTTIFVVPLWEGKYNITHHKDWCEWLKEQPYLEIANHGFTHINTEKKYESQEFIDKDKSSSDMLIKSSINLFNEVGIKCEGFRFPGWGNRPYQYPILAKYFKYVGDHFIGQKSIITTDGLYRIPYTLSIDNLHSTHYSGDDIIIVHSHINEKSGNNCINDKVIFRAKKWLKEIMENNKDNVEFLFMKDLVN